MAAAEQGHTATVCALLQGGAGTEHRDSLGRTAVSCAVLSGADFERLLGPCRAALEQAMPDFNN